MTESSPDTAINALAERFRASAKARRLQGTGVGSAWHRDDRTPVLVADHTLGFDARGPEGDTITRPASLFDDVFDAVSGKLKWGSQPRPPASRYRLPVAPVGRPHRATKRNYDYFQDLNAALAAQKARQADQMPEPVSDGLGYDARS